jgi:hypothetical protein
VEPTRVAAILVVETSAREAAVAQDNAALCVEDVEDRYTLTEREANEDTPFMDTTTSSWNDTKTSFKYDKLILMFFNQLF